MANDTEYLCYKILSKDFIGQPFNSLIEQLIMFKLEL